MSRLFSSMVTLSNGTDASSFTAKSDGVSSVLYKNVMYTYGGQVHDKVWGLNLGALKWTQHQCTGYIPFARSHHSAVQYSNYMLVYGGVLEQEGAEEPDSTPYYELDTDTFDWMRVQTFGESPGLRSHHAAITSGSKMYVLGGQDTSLGKDHALTAGDVQRSRAGGFYETFVLDVPSRTWSRPETTGTAPLLWGHTAVAFNQYILVYGGFDVTPEPESSGVVTSSPDSPPNCTLNEKVYILDTNTMVWRTSTPSAHSPAPASRTLHVSVVAGAEMVVFGGMTFESSGRAINVNDAWVWDIASGRWSKLEFCIPYWPSKKLLCVVHEGRLIVCHDLQSVHVLDFTDRRAGWVTYPVDPTLMFDARPTPSTPHPALPPPPAELPPPPPPQPAEAAAPVAETPELPPALPPAAAEPPAAAAQPPHEPEDFYSDHYSEPAAAAAAAPATPYYPPEPAPPVYYDHAAELHQPHPQPGDPHAALVPSPHRRVSSPARPAGAPLPPAPEVVRAPPPAPAPAGPSPRAQRVQDEMLARQAEMLREAERARQAAAVAKLQREMDDLRSELTGLSALKEKLNHSSAARAANVAGSTSPVRGHGGTFPVPVPDTAHNQHQYVQVNAMKDYLDTLHTQQHSVLMEQKARHGAYVNDLQATHEEHMKMLRERARTQGTAAQQVEAIASTADLEGKLREQLDEVRKQYDAMLELQRAPAYLQPAHRDAGGSAYPEEAEDMVQMINKLSAIPKAALGARGPSATPGPANPFAFNVPPAAPAAAAAAAAAGAAGGTLKAKGFAGPGVAEGPRAPRAALGMAESLLIICTMSSASSG
eukprot:Rhum_TRINITY_DN13530_c2_g1::Rhum_TRINITY_DN13530_c2_g1_i1::g.61111::m.61111